MYKHNRNRINCYGNMDPAECMDTVNAVFIPLKGRIFRDLFLST